MEQMIGHKVYGLNTISHFGKKSVFEHFFALKITPLNNNYSSLTV